MLDFTITNINPTVEPVSVISKLKFDKEIQIFCEDSFHDIKNKIWAKFGIPPFRQCLFTTDNSYSLEISINDIIIPVDIREVFTKKNSNDHSIYIEHIPINKFLADNKENIKVNNDSEYHIVGNKKMLYLVDLNTVLSNDILNIISNDSYRFDILYYGFIIMFWKLTHSEFKKYVKSQDKLVEDLENISEVKSRIKKEQKILSKMTSVKAQSKKNISIIDQKIQIDLGVKLIDIRNIIDWIPTSEKIPAIVGYISNSDAVSCINIIKKHISVNPNNESYETLNKIINKVRNVRFYKKTCKFVSFVIKYGLSYLIFTIRDIGKQAEIYIEYTEDQKIDFDENIAVIHKLTKPIIDKINNELHSAALPYGGKLVNVSKMSIVSQKLHVATYWKKLVSLKTFVSMKEQLREYEQAGILVVKEEECSHNEYHQDNCFLITFKKGMSNEDGREVKILLRTTDIKIEVFDSHEMDEFLIIQKYLFHFFDSIKDVHEHTPTDLNKYSLKTLYEKDPVLYDLKRYDKKLKVYSVLCQSSRQPILYTPEEYNKLSESKKKAITKWYNFTTQGNAYYECPNKEFQYLSFKVGKHPMGYCLPCCKKSKAEYEGSLSNEIEKQCLENKIVTPTDIRQTDYILTYDKFIPVGRMSKISDFLMSYITSLNSSCKACNYILLGVEQNLPALPNCGIIMSILESLIDTKKLKSVEDVINYINKKIVEMGNNFHLIGHGLAKVFDSPLHMVDTINNVFLHQSNGFNIFDSSETSFTGEEWNDIFISLIKNIFEVDVIILKDTDNIMTLTSSSDITLDNSKILFIVTNKTGSYPLCISNSQGPNVYIPMLQAYGNELYTMSIEPIIKFVEEHLSKISDVQGISQLCTIEDFLKNNKDWKVITKLVDSRNLCYGVILSKNSDYVYFPVYYTLYNKYLTDIDITYGSISDLDIKGSYNYNVLLEFIDEFNKMIDTNKNKCNLYRKIIPDQLLVDSNDKYIGFKADKLYYFHDQVDNTKEQFAGLPKKKILYDHRFIDANINNWSYNLLSNLDIDMNNIIRLEYKQKSYKLFITEFLHYTKQEKNKDIRSKLLKNINKTNYASALDINTLFEFIDSLLKEYYDDRMELKRIISDFKDTHKIKIYIENNLFDFDNLIINKLKNTDNLNEIKSEIKSIMDKLVKTVPEKNINDSNIINNIHLPCNSTTNIKSNDVQLGYCENSKLVIMDSLYKNFIEILSTAIYNNADIVTDNVFELLDFIKRPQETITIYSK